MTPQASPERMLELTHLLHYEAAILDDGLFEDWLALLHPEIDYFAPIRIDVLPPGEAAPGHKLAFFNESLMSLHARVAKLRTGLLQTEYP
ncbi:MAG: 3-phenylpropionate dioxygenase, partial [Phenylobacterium zucineum]